MKANEKKRMKAVYVNGFLACLGLLTFSAQSNAAFTMMMDRNIGTPQKTQMPPSGSGTLFTLEQGDGAAIRLAGNFFNEPADAVALQGGSYFTPGRNSPVASATILVGFLCVSMVRDRRVWAALFCLAINPVVVEARRVESMVRNIGVEMNTVDEAVNYGLHNNTIKLDNKLQHRFYLKNAVRISGSVFEKAQPQQSIQGMACINSLRRSYIRRIRIKADEIHVIPLFLFTPDSLSRPPPTDIKKVGLSF